MHPARSRPNGRDSARGRDAEIVVAVEVHRHVDEIDRDADQLLDRLGRRDPERVDDDDFLRPGLDRSGVDTLVEVALGPRRVDAEERRMNAVLVGETHGARDALEHLLARDADRIELQVGDRRLDHREPHSQLDERLQVGRHGAREAPDLGPESRGGDQLDRAPVVVGDAREAGLDAVDPELVEQPRDLELLLGIEHHTDGLLAVAQRRVVEADMPPDHMGVVQRTGPDQIAQVTTPSGKGESFSAPSPVIRKLSSTRSPPPPSQ